MITQAAKSIARLTLIVGLLAILGACATQPVSERVATSGSRPSAALSLGESAATIALQQVGVPYRYGGDSRSGFDCSGLVHYAYGRAGKIVPRTTGQLWSKARPVGNGDLKPGDVLFFRIDGKMSHVGLYLGNRRFVHAPSTGRSVSVADLDSSFYAAAFLRAGRP